VTDAQLIIAFVLMVAFINMIGIWWLSR